MTPSPSFTRDLLANCLDHHKAFSSMELLVEHLQTDDGVEALEKLNMDGLCGPFVVFFSAGMKQNPNLDRLPHLEVDADFLEALVRNYFPSDTGRLLLTPTDECVQSLRDWVISDANTPSLREYIVRKNLAGAAPGWLRRESFKSALAPGFLYSKVGAQIPDPARKLQPIETALFRLHFCLLRGETDQYKFLLMHAWGVKEYVFWTERQKMQALMREKDHLCDVAQRPLPRATKTAKFCSSCLCDITITSSLKSPPKKKTKRNVAAEPQLRPPKGAGGLRLRDITNEHLSSLKSPAKKKCKRNIAAEPKPVLSQSS